MTKKKISKKKTAKKKIAKKKVVAKKGNNKNAPSNRRKVPNDLYLSDGSMRELNPKHKSFADNYRTCGFHPVESYFGAGYAEQSKASAAAAAGKILARPEVIEYLRIKSREAEERADVTQEGVLKDLVSLKEMCMGRDKTPIYHINEDGELYERGVKVLNAQGAKGSLELLGKHLKMFQDKGQTNIERLQVNFNFNLLGEQK